MGTPKTANLKQIFLLLKQHGNSFSQDMLKTFEKEINIVRARLKKASDWYSRHGGCTGYANDGDGL